MLVWNRKKNRFQNRKTSALLYSERESNLHALRECWDLSWPWQHLLWGFECLCLRHSHETLDLIAVKQLCEKELEDDFQTTDPWSDFLTRCVYHGHGDSVLTVFPLLDHQVTWLLGLTWTWLIGMGFSGDLDSWLASVIITKLLLLFLLRSYGTVPFFMEGNIPAQFRT